MNKTFASQADWGEQNIKLVQMSPHCWAYIAEGDPNSGVIIGQKAILVCDCTATPEMAQKLIQEIRQISDLPIKYIVLSHYHAVRVLGAQGFVAEGLSEIIASYPTWEMIQERGAQDMRSEIERFPRLFRGVDSIPGLTYPTLVIGGSAKAVGRDSALRVDLGGITVEIWHPGAGHTRGDTIVWLESERVLFSGDLVECDAGVYTGDAQLAEWPHTLEQLRLLSPEHLVPGRGTALSGSVEVNRGLDFTKRWIEILWQSAQQAVQQQLNLKQAMELTRQQMDPVFAKVFLYEHCLPFDVSRAYDEASGIKHPRIWTAERDLQMWQQMQG
ncbi:MAG: MBL fold metallo-hydrolase [Gammaproteobacteria bacterium]|nr:MBL fold metallo-hydrolase [Gammaproteobacteria bacterium]